MNLLEHYIEKVIEEKELDDKFVRVKFFGNCWGDKREYSATVTRKAWEYAKKQGYIFL